PWHTDAGLSASLLDLACSAPSARAPVAHALHPHWSTPCAGEERRPGAGLLSGPFLQPLPGGPGNPSNPLRLRPATFCDCGPSSTRVTRGAQAERMPEECR